MSKWTHLETVSNFLFAGYFSLNLEKMTDTRFVSEYEDLARLVNSKQIKSLEDYGNCMRVTTERAGKRSSLKGNVIIGTFITSLARRAIHEAVLQLGVLLGDRQDVAAAAAGDKGCRTRQRHKSQEVRARAPQRLHVHWR